MRLIVGPGDYRNDLVGAGQAAWHEFYYLLGSAGGFRSRGKQVWQIVMTHHGTPQPDCRFS